MWYIWLIIAGVCFIIEMLTVGFLIFWFGIGALITMVVSIFFPGNYILQGIVFVVSSTLLIFLTKPLAEKISKSNPKVSTNAFSIIGKKGIVSQDINPTHGVGQIKISNEIWSAKTSDDSIIKKGSEIEVISIEGVKAIVKLANASPEAVTK